MGRFHFAIHRSPLLFEFVDVGAGLPGQADGEAEDGGCDGYASADLH